jgi:SAM-dependent methyltransferase
LVNMKISDIVQRLAEPQPWSEGDNIPWNEPGFSERMLKEHFSQEHDGASRRSVIIDRHVQWIDSFLLQGKPSKILDLGCGPGLYASRLAKLGHTCTGIDFSPASIRYARQHTAPQNTYIEGDIRQASFGEGYDLAMLIYGEFNVFRPADAKLILRKAQQALKPGGMLLLEPHTFAAVRSMGDQPPRWYSTASGLFSEQPHLCLQERHWDESSRTVTTRFYIIDSATSEVTRYAQSFQSYTDEQYVQVLTECGFEAAAFYPSLAGETIPGQEDFVAVTARVPERA